MRLLKSLVLLPLALLAGRAFGAKKTSEERFQQFHSKALISSPVKLSDTTYKSLTATPRDYSVSILLTALDARYGCQLCREFQPEWDLLSKSWTKGDKKGQSRVIFATIDFEDGRDTFLSLGLQTAPVLLHFQPTTGPHAVSNPDPLRFDFTGGQPTAERVHAWISRHMPDRPHPAVSRPVDYMRWAGAITMLLGIVTAAVTMTPYILPIVQSRNLWAAGSLIAILLFTSGHMFNHIRKVPYVAGNGRGGISYFAAGFQSQYGLETQAIAAIYGILSFCAITLTVKVPRMANPNSQRFAVLAWSGVLFVMYSLLLSIFRIKNGGYPFSLPPFM